MDLIFIYHSRFYLESNSRRIPAENCNTQKKTEKIFESHRYKSSWIRIFLVMSLNSCTNLCIFPMQLWLLKYTVMKLFTLISSCLVVKYVITTFNNWLTIHFPDINGTQRVWDALVRQLSSLHQHFEISMHYLIVIHFVSTKSSSEYNAHRKK